MSKGKYFYSLIYLLVLFGITGCSSAIVIKASADKSANIQFAMDIGRTLSDSITTLSSSMSGSTEKREIFSKETIEQIRKSFVGSDFRNVRVASPTATGLAISGTIPAPETQKAVTANNIKAANFVTCTSNSLTVILSPATSRQLVRLMPAESKDYLDLFMAPIFTGEKMTVAEYRDLIAAVYGEELAVELDKSTIKISLAPPDGRTIRRSSLSETERSRTSTNKAVFTIPLLEFFTLQSAKTFSIAW